MPPARTFAVGVGVSRRVSAGVSAGIGPGVASRALDGTGGTTEKRTSPEPAASAPPTTMTAAAARSVKPCRRLSGRSGAGVVAGIAARLSRRSSGAVSVSPTSAA